MAPDALLTTSDAATELGVNKQRVRALISAGRLPATMFGGSWAIKRADLERVRKTGRPRKNPGR